MDLGANKWLSAKNVMLNVYKMIQERRGRSAKYENDDNTMPRFKILNYIVTPNCNTQQRGSKMVQNA